MKSNASRGQMGSMSNFPFLSSFLVLCLSFCHGIQSVPQVSLTEIEVLHASKLQNLFELRLDSASSLHDESGLRSIRLKYKSSELVDLPRARQMVVTIVESMLQDLNAELHLRSFEAALPFAPEDLEVWISYDSFWGQCIDLQYVGEVRLQGGQVSYRAFNALDPSSEKFQRKSEEYAVSKANVDAHQKAIKALSFEGRHLGGLSLINEAEGPRFIDH